MERAISLFGLFIMIGLAWLMSSNRKKISLRMVVGGLLLQFVFAIVMLRTPLGDWFFVAVNWGFAQLNVFVEAGSGFAFNVNGREGDPELPPQFLLLRTFAFGVLPTVIVFASLMSVLYYIGVMEWIVKGMAWVMQRTLGTSGAESLGAAANVFVGHTEAPLVVRPYIAQMTTSELNALMVGGFATITGGLMAAFVGMNINAGHLMMASVISAPAALVIAKILQPETESPVTLGSMDFKLERQGVNVIEAAAIGATDGMKLAINIAAMLIAFLALIAMVDALFGGLGDGVSHALNLVLAYEEPFALNWSLQGLFGYLFSPLAWAMGIQMDDCREAGRLLGLKMVANEFVAYSELSTLIAADTPTISKRTETILTYALCGFSNFGAIAIQLGGIGGLAPERRSDLARLGLRAMLGGMLACCMTACIAGFLI